MVKRQLGRRLRRLRETAGKTHEDVAESQTASRNKIWKIETGRCAVKRGDVLALALLYEMQDRAVLDELVALADATRSSSYLEDYPSGAVPQALGLYSELEAAATSVQVYSSELIHGLFQTPAYARAVINADRTLDAGIVDQRVSFRIEHQRRFFGGSQPGSLQMITTAGVLNLQVGSSAVMEEQLARLRAMSREEAVDVRVLSADNGVHRTMRGPFVVLDFEDDDDPSVAFVENIIGNRYLDRPGDVARFRQAFAEMRAQTLPLEGWLDEHPR